MLEAKQYFKRLVIKLYTCLTSRKVFSLYKKHHHTTYTDEEVFKFVFVICIYIYNAP